METKRFTKNDDGFVCSNCGRKVPPLGYSSRNHCPFCLWSLHLDVSPGDRASDCGGKMRPVAAEPNAKKGYIITHECEKCRERRRCRVAADDDISLVIALTVHD